MKSNPPDAVILSLPAGHLPWREFRRCCSNRIPSVPVLFESCVFASAEEAGFLEAGDETRFLKTPTSRREFQGAIARLLLEVRDARDKAAF